MLQLLRSLKIMFVCAWHMLTICCYGISMGIRGKLTRPLIDAKLQQWAHKMVRALEIRATLCNPHHIDITAMGKVVLLANHASLFDIPVAYHLLPGSIRMLAKKDLFSIPIFGRALRAAQIPQIDRQNRTQAIQDIAHAAELMQQGILVWIFAEGTRSTDGKLLPLKKGGFVMAIESGATIIPITICGTQRILPKKTWRFRAGQEVTVHIGMPISTTGYTVENKDVLIEQVSAEMRAHLACGSSPASS